MKTLVKKSIAMASFLLVMVFSAAAFAEDRGAEIAAELAKELELTQAQQESVAKVMEEHFEKIQTIADSEDSRFKKIRSMRSQNKTKNAALEEILSDEQYEKYTAMVKEKREELKANRKQ